MLVELELLAVELAELVEVAVLVELELIVELLAVELDDALVLYKLYDFLRL